MMVEDALLTGLILAGVGGVVLNKMAFSNKFFAFITIITSITMVVGYIYGVLEFDYEILIYGIIGSIIILFIYMGIFRSLGWVILAPISAVLGTFIIISQIMAA